MAPTSSKSRSEDPPPISTITTAYVMTVTASTMKAATVSTRIFEVFKKTPSTLTTPTTPGRVCLAVPAQPPPYLTPPNSDSNSASYSGVGIQRMKQSV